MSPNNENQEKLVDSAEVSTAFTGSSTELDETDGFELGFNEVFKTEWDATLSPFAVADLEVTDAPAQDGEILQFSALLVNPDGEITAEFSQMVRVKGPVPQWLLTALKISQSDIDREGQPLADVMKSFVEFIGDRPVFIHYAEFEAHFMKKAAEAIEQEFCNPLHDTLLLSQLTWPELPSHAGQVLADRVGMTNLLETSLDCAKLTLAALLAAREDAFSGSRIYLPPPEPKSTASKKLSKD